ncbi:armadillo-type protein [Kalaharituber pfeilii]|nr:armadillo-type protein [Kalaharituber pfeilii]
MAEEEPDYSHLPITDRAVHKVWKVRKAAYEEAAAAFAKTPDESDPYFHPWISDAGIWNKIVMDSNVAAQQEGIAALCSFLKYGGDAACTRTRSHTVGALVEKGLSSTRAATKASSMEAILLYVENDAPAPVIDALLPFLSHKMPKVIAATVQALIQIYSSFGARTVDPKPVLKFLPKLFGHADKTVRAETTTLCVELYKWLKEAIKPMFFNELKPVQQKELEEAFEKVKSETPKQERLLKSQQVAAAAAATSASGADEEEEQEAEIDAYDLSEPVNVLSKLPPEFYTNMSSSKWKERKEALDALFPLVNVPRIKDDDYKDLIAVLAKAMKDANIAVVTVAANCIESTAKGLRAAFLKHKAVVLSPILERLKEKKQSVVDALSAALDGVFMATSLTDCLEEILEFLKHKNPQVKLETLKWLIRCLKETKVPPTKSEQKSIAESCTKLLGDTSEPVRTSSCEAMGTLMKIIGERGMNPYMEGLDDIRKTKIKEFFESAVVKAKEKPAAPAAPKGAKKPPAAAKPAAAAAPPPAKKEDPPPSSAAAPRSGPGPSKLAGPKLAGPGTLRLQKKPPPSATASAAPAALSPPSPKRAPAPPSPTEEAPPAPKLTFGGRGLTSRPLSAAQPPQPQHQHVHVVDPGLSAAEKAELEALRMEKEKWLRQANEAAAERTRLLQQVNDLQIQNAELIEAGTRDNLAIRAKDAQLVRARTDAEQAEAQNAKLQREIERLKRELARSVRATSPPPPDVTEQLYRDPMNGLGPSSLSHHLGSVDRSSKRLSYASTTFSEEKENGYERHKMVSPTFSTMSEGRNSPSRGVGTDNAESWKRAAEVTNALKARIEQMKRQNGIGR